MPRVHTVKSARKARPEMGLEVGETYHWWKFKNRFGNGTIVRSKTYPRASQLTRSEFLGAMYGIQEEIEDLEADEDLESTVGDIAGRARELGEEQTEKRENMPESLQDGDTGSLLEERSQAMSDWADELEGVSFPARSDYEGDEDDEDDDGQEDYDSDLEEALGQVQSAEPSL